MAKKDDDVYSKFLHFLRSPMWTLPVMGFVEQRSIVFDKDAGDDKLYKQIHTEFRSIVDMLIGCFCEDTGIKPEQISKEIAKDSKVKNRPEIELSMLEPVLAAGEYDIFVHMMMRKNIELQLQALQMIEAMCGALPAVLMGAKVESESGSPEEQERIILIQVMKQSEEEYKREQEKDKEELRAVLQASKAERQRLEGQKAEESALVEQAMRMSLSDGTKRPQSAVKPGKKENKPVGAQVEELEKRREYLKQQRDKLLNMKREARIKALSDAEAKGCAPFCSTCCEQGYKTARAAASALGSRGSSGPGPKIDPSVLEARKALAAKLKAELM